jgi:hypothetical protein
METCAGEHQHPEDRPVGTGMFGGGGFQDFSGFPLLRNRSTTTGAVAEPRLAGV